MRYGVNFRQSWEKLRSVRDVPCVEETPDVCFKDLHIGVLVEELCGVKHHNLPSPAQGQSTSSAPTARYRTPSWHQPLSHRTVSARVYRKSLGRDLRRPGVLYITGTLWPERLLRCHTTCFPHPRARWGTRCSRNRNVWQVVRQLAGILHAICNHFAEQGTKLGAAGRPGPDPNALAVELDGPHLPLAVNL